jgi:hypothetical protein
MADEVVAAPVLSVAFAVIECVPAGAFVHVKVKGAVVDVPNNVAPLKKSTLLTDPSASNAFAIIVIFAGVVKVLLSAGMVILTVGATFATVILMADEVVSAPLLSVAFAVSE